MQPHWTPRYIKNRLLVILDEHLHPDHPWLTSDAVKILDRRLSTSHVGAEFGSGRSTLWFAKRIKHLTSIENNPEWFDRIHGQLCATGLIDKVRYIKDHAGLATHALAFPDDLLDFCLVDGGDRDKCALNILPKLKSGGLLAIDNINWYLPNTKTHSPNSLRNGYASALWAAFADQVKSWPRQWTSNGVTDTAIWIKP